MPARYIAIALVVVVILVVAGWLWYDNQVQQILNTPTGGVYH
jgi:hypothetical protein